MPDTHTRTQHGLAQCPMCAYKYRDPIRADLLAALEAICELAPVCDDECGHEECSAVSMGNRAIRKARGEE